MPLAPEILHSTLEYYGHGRALWCPEPPVDDGEAHEIQIGDVGYFDEDGGFKRMFNVMEDRDHELNKGGVPDGFVPLKLQKRLFSRREDQFPPTAFHSRTVKSEKAEGHAQASVGGYAGGGLAYNFHCSSSVGGLLILRDSADKTVVPSAQTITQYIRQHHDSWYAFATGPATYGIECRPEDIIMVRGFIKTSAWAVAAFPEGASSSHEISFSGQVGPFADAGFDFSKSRHRQVAFEHRIGPVKVTPRSPSRASVASGKSRATSSTDLPSVKSAAGAVDANAKDQAVFLGYFKTLKRAFWRKKIKAAAGYDTIVTSPDDDDDEPDTTVEAHPRHQPVRTALDDVLEYILLRSDAEVAVVSDADLSELFGGEHWPEDINAWLYEHMPTIDVDDDKTGTISILEAIRRSHAAEAQRQEIAAGIAWEARQAELIAQHEREEAERAIRQVQEQEARERAEFEQGSSGQQGEAAPAVEPEATAAGQPATETEVPAAGHSEAAAEAPTVEAEVPAAEAGVPDAEAEVPAAEHTAPPAGAETAAVDEDVTMQEAESTSTPPSTEGEPEASAQPDEEPSNDAPERPGQPSFSDPEPLSSFIPEFLEERISGTCVTTDGHVIVPSHEGGPRSSTFPHTMLTDKSAEGGGVSSISISKSGHLVATGCEDCYVRIWDLDIGSLTSKLDKHADTVWTVCFSPDGTRLVSGSADKKAVLWDLHTRDVIAEMNGHEADVWLSDFSPDSKFVATGSVDCTVRLWDGRNGRSLHKFEGHNAVIMGVKFSPDGSKLATYADNMVHLWDVANGASIARLQGHTSVIWSLAFSADSSRIVTAAEDQSCRVWDSSTGDELVTINEHTGPVWSATFSPDGLAVASGSYDTLIIVCDSFTSEKFHTLERDTSSIVNIVAYSAAGDLLAAGHADGTVRVYDPHSGEFVAEFRGHDDKVKTVEFMPDDNLLVSSSDDGTVRIWNMLDALRL